MSSNKYGKKHVSKLPEALYNKMQQGKSIALVGTFSEKGNPHTSLLQFIYPIDQESVLISINKNRKTYDNLVWQKMVSVTLVEENDLCFSFLARAGVVQAPSFTHPEFYIVRLDIVDIKSDKSQLISIDKGIKWHFKGDAEMIFSISMMAELKVLAGEI